VLLGLALGLFGFRLALAGDPTLSFLVWNLFLAAIPYAIAESMTYLSSRRCPSLALGALGLVWLLFLPNAPYIVTDLVHVDTSSALHAAFDSGTICAFACAGLVLGYGSLLRVQALVEERIGHAAGWAVALISLVLSAVGVYLGRAQQLNSWDVVARPDRILATMREILAPAPHSGAFAAAASAATVFVVAYVLADRLWTRKHGPRGRAAPQSQH
jgi:uncharacterized membrane protein